VCKKKVLEKKKETPRKRREEIEGKDLF